MNKPIAILGAGNMASALALNLARHKRPIRLYCIEADVEDEITKNRCNTKYLAGHRFPKNVSASNNLAAVVNDADVVFVAVPSFAVHDVLVAAMPDIESDAIIASVSKGLDAKTLEPLAVSETRALPSALRQRMCMIGGPAIAVEMAKGSPTAMIVASKDKASAQTIKKLLETETVKIATSRDILGVGLASAIKNAYAIALGMCDGLHYPTNTKALILTVALEEMRYILEKSDALPETAYGLAGLGDLMVTGFSPHGRNRTYGEKLVTANSSDPKTLGLTTVEGVETIKLVTKIVARMRAKHVLPLQNAIDLCLRARKNYAEPFKKYLKSLRLT